MRNLGAHLDRPGKARLHRGNQGLSRQETRTRVAITRTGRTAFDDHVAYLREIIDG